MRVAAALGLAALVGVAGAAEAQSILQPKLSATVAPQGSATGTLSVGDRSVVTLELTVPAGLSGEPRFPTWGKTWGDAEVVGVEPVERSGGSQGETSFHQRVTVAAFRPGKVPLPPVAVVVPQTGGSRTLSTPAGLALQVASVILGDPKEATAKPPAPPRSLPWGRRFWWTFAAMSIVAVTLGAWVFARRKAAEISAPALPPLEELERELARLAAGIAGLGSIEGGGAPARFAAALSSALRRYLGRELAFPALESTTTEIQRRLRTGKTPEGISRPGVDLLRRLDRIKFSRREAAVPDNSAGEAIFSEAVFSEAITAARAIAAGLDRHLRPAPAPDLPTSAPRSEAAR